ncbi:MAG: hypothetical protein AABY00_00625 [Nanoarchaeota archaeon]
MRKYILLRSIGIACLVWGLLAILHAAFVLHKYHDFFWLCYIGLFLIGIGLLIKNDMLVQSQLLILFIPDVLWTVDLVTYALRGYSFLGISDYFYSSPLITQLVSLQHVAIVPFALIILTKQSALKKWIFSFAIGEIIIAFIFSRFLTPLKDNVNCVYQFCGNILFPEPYFIWWFILTLAYISLAYVCFTFLFKKKQLI